MWIRAAALIFTFSTIGAAQAQDMSGCEKFKWSIARERAWFAASPKAVDAGAELPSIDQGYVVTLAAGDSPGFVLPPERAPKPGTFGGVVKFTLAKAGVYEVTLSGEAWADVVQDGARLKSFDFSGQKACPGVRKSVKFHLAAGPAALQISNSDATKITLAVAPAE